VVAELNRLLAGATVDSQPDRQSTSQPMSASAKQLIGDLVGVYHASWNLGRAWTRRQLESSPVHGREEEGELG